MRSDNNGTKGNIAGVFCNSDSGHLHTPVTSVDLTVGKKIKRDSNKPHQITTIIHQTANFTLKTLGDSDTEVSAPTDLIPK